MVTKESGKEGQPATGQSEASADADGKNDDETIDESDEEIDDSNDEDMASAASAESSERGDGKIVIDSAESAADANTAQGASEATGPASSDDETHFLAVPERLDADSFSASPDASDDDEIVVAESAKRPKKGGLLRRFSRNPKKGAPAVTKVSVKLSRLVHLRAVHYKPGAKRWPWEMCSLSESKLAKQIKASPDGLVSYHQATFTRVYPKGTRVSSTNCMLIYFFFCFFPTIVFSHKMFVLFSHKMCFILIKCLFYSLIKCLFYSNVCLFILA